MYKKVFSLLLAVMLTLSLCACAVTITDPPAEPEQDTDGSQPVAQLTLTVNGRAFTVLPEQGEAADALLQQLPLSLEMEELNGNEKYALLPDALPKDEEKVGQIHAGDLMLYGDNCIVLFYRDFATEYSYTRLGRVEDTTGLAEAAGSGTAQVTLTAAQQESLLTENALYQDILLKMGASRAESGVIEPWQPSIYYTYYDDGFADASQLDVGYYYVWFLHYSHSLGLQDEEYAKRFASPFGENTGWAFPAEDFEPAVTRYFGVTAEQLRSSELYHAQYNCYWQEMMGGRGATPELEVYSAAQEDDILTLHLSLIYTRIYVPSDNVFMTLTVRLLPDGGWQYLSYLPDEDVTPEQRESIYRELCDAPTEYGVPYRNTTYGFTLNLPSDWKGRYSVNETTLYYTDGDEYVPTIEFRYQDDARSPLFWVSAVPLEQKELFQENCNNYLWAGENDAYGFAIRDARDWDNPYRGESKDYKWLHAMRLSDENLAQRLTAS